jgi:hypothetical protein
MALSAIVSIKRHGHGLCDHLSDRVPRVRRDTVLQIRPDAAFALFFTVAAMMIVSVPAS